MTASRTCPACGAGLPADVRWCLRCFEPVRQFTLRDAQLPTLSRAEPVPAWARLTSQPPERAAPRIYSRWHAGPTTFGVWGRLALTALVLLVLPWGSINWLSFFFLFGYAPIAFFALRWIWRKEAVVLSTGPVERALPDVRQLAALRVATAVMGVALVAVAVVAGWGLPVTLLPALPFLLAAFLPIASDPVVGLVALMQ